MLPHSDSVTDEYDRPVPGSKVYVYNIDGTEASLTTDGVAVLAQPILTDEFGGYSYYADTGYYREDIWYTGKLRFRHSNIAIGNPGSDLALRFDLSQAAGADAIGVTGGGTVQDKFDTIASASGGAGVGFQQTGAGAVARTVSAAIKDRAVSVKDFGAVGDGIADDTLAFTKAFAVGTPVFVPVGDYLVTPGLAIPTGLDLYGESCGGATGTGSSSLREARIIFSGTGVAGLTQASPTVPVQHGSIRNIVFDTTDTAHVDWLMDFNGLLDFRFEGVRAENRWTGGGGLRSRQIGSNPTWLNALTNCQIRVPDAGTKYALDMDWSDCWVTAGAYTGGLGTIVRGPGNIHLMGSQFDRANTGGAGLTLYKATLSAGQIKVIGCSLDDNLGPGIKIDLSASPSGTSYCPLIVGNTFRNPTAATDIVITPHASAVIGGIVIANNAFSESVPVPWTVDLAKVGVTFGPNSLQTAANIRNFSRISTGWLDCWGYTVAQLPVVATGLMKAFVTDASVAASGNFGAIVAGGGANKVPVFSDGSNWRIG